MIVKLPGGKSIVIDSKVLARRATSSAHREDATDDERRAGLADHARQVRDAHPVSSGRRRTGGSCRRRRSSSSCSCPTSRRGSPRSSSTPSLYELALSNNVIPASPTNLIGLLRAVHYGWQQETIAESAREISDLGRELYKRLATMGAHMSKLGRTLDGAVKAYNETVGSLERQVLVTGAALRAARDHRRSSRPSSSADRAPDAAARGRRARGAEPQATLEVSSRTRAPRSLDGGNTLDRCRMRCLLGRDTRE